MNCFVASAFDHKDVDGIYDCGILPVLRELRLHPTRVDRVEHNDDIDDQIFALIDQAQLCIADLTHARPSVYYEAGYASGTKKPVIYVARRDHLHARENDTAGNLRVHFDLQMKNIIPWTEPNKAFRKRLASRIRHVLKPILRVKQITKACRQHEMDFAAMSQNDRLREVLQKGQSLLRSRGYSGGLVDEGPYGVDQHHAQLHKNSLKTHRTIHIVACPAVTRTGLRTIRSFWRLYAPKQEYAEIRSVESMCVVVALRSVRATTLTALLPSWTPVEGKVFERHDMGSFGDEVRNSTSIAFIDGVKSLEECSERFRELIDELDGSQQAGRHRRRADDSGR